LFRAGAGRDIAVGGVVAGRDEADLDELVGFFVNLIVLRTDLSGDPTVSELLTRVRESSLTALSHQNVPFELVVQHVNPDRIPGRNPLTDIALLLQNNTAARLALPGTQSRVTVLRTGAPRFGVLVEAADDYAPDGTPCGVTLTVEYQTDGFERGAIERLASSLLDCLAVMSSDPGARLGLPDVPVPLAAPGRLDPPEGHEGGAGTPDDDCAPHQPPRTELEGRLAVIWADVLQVEQVGRDDNFFSLGGDSLRAIRVATRIALAEDLPARPDQIFLAPTVAGLAEALARQEPRAGDGIPRAPRVARNAGPR
jgi:non-ribosomal peptide synthetase component F